MGYTERAWENFKLNFCIFVPKMNIEIREMRQLIILAVMMVMTISANCAERLAV